MSLARRFLVLQLVVVALVTLAVSLVLFAHERGAVVERAEAVTRVLATALADDPYVLAAAGDPDPHSALQPLTDRLLADTELDFVTIMAPDGTRWTHPWPSSVGEAYRGDRSHALAGETWTSTERGNLGPSVRTIAPVRDEDGTVVALVATGVLLEAVSQQALAQLPAVLLVGLLLLAASATVAALGARYLGRVTHGWGPEELAQVHSLHDAVLNEATEGLLLVDTAGAVPVLNARARELLGIRAPAPGPARRRPLPVADLGLPSALEAVLLSGASVQEQWFVVTERTLIVSTLPARGALAGRGTIVILRDHTEISRLSGQLRATATLAGALRAQTHEHANRMHTVVSLLELGRDEEALGFASADMVRTQVLSEDLLAHLDDPFLAALLVGKTAAAHERGVELEVVVDPEVPRIPVSPADLVTLVGNLVDNAVEAAAANAARVPPVVEVEITRAPDAADQALDTVVITVADTGMGIPEELAHEVFELGVSTKPAGPEGRGVGLHLVREVVDRWGARIEHGNDGGAVFTVTVPVPHDTTAGRVP
ncbi:ATP-binding protein [uncultured Kocuria sp.]|uniref:sensor histidine kinase n=1 Tax=uncultured Kocuria sp. TaxID=259305 RepID=UPI002616BEB0|nr:ATP-binding protein [uncultured Kocuria sp.]